MLNSAEETLKVLLFDIRQNKFKTCHVFKILNF